MSIYVPTAKDAYVIAYDIATKLLRKKTVLKLESKLETSLRNITIHGFNFKSGGDDTMDDTFESAIGAEIQIKVGEKSMHETMEQRRRDTIDHSMYEFKRIKHDDDKTEGSRLKFA